MFLSRRIAVIVAVLLTYASQIDMARAVDTAPAFEDAQLQARYDALTSQLRCLVCQNETIADSNASLAADLRAQLRSQIAEGKSDAEVLKYMTDRYGAFVLYKPPFESRTWVLWLGPGIFLLIGLVVAVRVILQRAKLAAQQPEESVNADESV